MSLSKEKNLSYVYGLPLSGATTVYTAGNASSGSLLEANSFYRLETEQDIYICFGTSGSSPVADSSCAILYANIPEIIGTSSNIRDMAYTRVSTDCSFRVTRLSASISWIK